MIRKSLVYALVPIAAYATMFAVTHLGFFAAGWLRVFTPRP